MLRWVSEAHLRILRELVSHISLLLRKWSLCSQLDLNISQENVTVSALLKLASLKHARYLVE